MAIKPIMGKTKGRLNKVDRELKKILDRQMKRIKVIGTGGAGNNAVTRMSMIGIQGAETIVVNTDAQDLLYSNADKKVLIGKDLTGGLGAGGDPKVGEEAAKENRDDIKKVLQGSDMVFITCGLGGGTGTGSAPIIAQTAKKLGLLTVGIATLPFTMEGQQRMKHAIEGLDNLRRSVDTLVVIPNDKMLQIVPNVSVPTAFKIVDEVLVNAVKGVIELITKPGLVNLDFADVKAVISNGGLAMIGMGESNSDKRATESILKALNDPFLPVEINGAKGALINIIGGPGITVSEARDIVEVVSSKLEKDAKIIWGAKLDKELGDSIKTMLIVTGVTETEVFGQAEGPTTTDQKRMEEYLDVEFVGQ